MRETGQSWLSLLKKKGEQRGGLEKGSRGVYTNADVRADRVGGNRRSRCRTQKTRSEGLLASYKNKGKERPYQIHLNLFKLKFNFRKMDWPS